MIIYQFITEPIPGIEPGTSSLPRKCSTAELYRHWSERRGSNPRPSAWKANALSTELLSHFQNLWAVMDSNHRKRKLSELQSDPFGHSGNCPKQILSLLSDSNQRPRDYKSRALAN